MCSMCLQSPCHPRCPNAEEPESVMTCSRCGQLLFEGDEYLDSEEGPICKECVDDMSGYEMMAAMDCSLNTVKKEEL